MRLANVGGRAAVIVDGRVLDVEQASGGDLGPDPRVLSDLANHDRLRVLAAAAAVASLPPLDEGVLQAPVPRPGKAIALALNYRSHAEEAGRAIPDEPHVMVKFPSSITGPYDDVVVPAGRGMIDYEAEIVLVIGRRCTKLGEADAWDAVAGVTGGQDVSDREEQFRPPVRQFSMAKSYDTFGPTGPVLVTLDELRDRDDIGLACRIDGVQVQQGRSSDFIFPVPRMLAWLTRFATLEPGDLVWTGTPGGVGEARTPPLFLRDGTVVETEIEGVGVLRNRAVVR